MNSKSILPLKTFLAYSLGCRTNQAEVESISLQLTAHSLQQFDNRLALTDYRLPRCPDLVLLNTCVVTQKAEKETRQKIRELRKKYPKSFLVVIGCGVTAKERFNISLPEADLLVSNEEKENITEIICKCIVERDPSISVGMTMDDRHSDRASQERVSGEIPLTCGVGKGSLDGVYPERSRGARDDILNNKYILSGRKFIKIQEGCDKFCSFCITAYLRGKPTSIPPEKIIEEVNFWVKKGIKEIILTGINIGLYNSRHSDQVPPTAGRVEESLSPPLERDPSTTLGMTYLINKILAETKIERISFSSIDPEMLTDDFVKLVVNNPRVSQYFHLSLQSGSQTVLERMNREADLSRLLKILKQIKADNPLFTFRADIITGFSDETEKEFQETLDFIKKTEISFVHLFHFSARPNTKAEQMIKSGSWHEVPPAIKKQRLEILGKEVEKIRKEEARKMIGVKINCLIVRELHRHSDQIPLSFRAIRQLAESRGIPFSGKTMERDPSTSVGMTKDPLKTWEGLTENGWPVFVKQQSNKAPKHQRLKGKILSVKIYKYNKYLFGRIT